MFNIGLNILLIKLWIALGMCCNLFWFEISLSARLREGRAARKRLAFNGNFSLILTWYLLSLVLLMMGIDKSGTEERHNGCLNTRFGCRNVNLLIIIRTILECHFKGFCFFYAFRWLFIQGTSICHTRHKGWRWQMSLRLLSSTISYGCKSMPRRVDVQFQW